MPFAINYHELANGDLLITNLEPVGEKPIDIYDALERMTSNGFGWIRPEEIGALTSAPILGEDVVRDDEGEFIKAAKTWWYPQYEVYDPAERLVEMGRIIFTRAPEDEEKDS